MLDSIHFGEHLQTLNKNENPYIPSFPCLPGMLCLSPRCDLVSVLLVQLVLCLEPHLLPGNQRACCPHRSGADWHGGAGLWPTTSWPSRHCLFLSSISWLACTWGGEVLLDLLPLLEWFPLSLTRPLIMQHSAAWPGLFTSPPSFLCATESDSILSTGLVLESFVIYELLVDTNRLLQVFCHGA